jgi:hypothetical protein
MTFFDQLQLPGPAVVVTVSEVRSGLVFEVTTITRFISFVLAVCVLLSVGRNPSQLVWVSFFLVWRILTQFRHLKSIFLEIFLSLSFLLLLVRGLDVSMTFFRIMFLLVAGFHSGFHPWIRLFLHVPLSSPAVQTGLVLTMLDLAMFCHTRFLAVAEWILGVFAVCFLAITAALMAETAVIHTRQTKPGFTVHAPWTDVVASAKCIVQFRLMTGLKISSLIRVFGSFDEPVSINLLIELLGQDRGSSVWEFLVHWCPYRLEKQLGSRITSKSNFFSRPDAPLTSPLLRGY